MARRRQYLSYEEARQLLQKLQLNINSSTDWATAYSLGECPRDIPGLPYKHYKDNGWVSWKHFLGLDKGPTLSFDEAHKISISKGFANREEWAKWARSDECDVKFPAKPEAAYKDSGWKGWPHFLTGKEKVGFVSYGQCAQFARERGITTQAEWKKMCIKGDRPDGIPANPQIYYKKSNEWQGWPAFLGAGGKKVRKENQRFSIKQGCISSPSPQ